MNKERIIPEVISIVGGLVIFWILYLFCLPVIKIGAVSMLVYFGLSLLIVTFTVNILSYDYLDCSPIISYIIGCATLIIGMLLALISSPLFNAYVYHTSFEVVQAEEDAPINIPTIDDISNISLMDTNSAMKLGDRTLGSLSEYVSQYEVSDRYYTISYQGKIMKIAPLEYGGFFKAINNDSIPGYVLVDPNTNEASFVKVEKGIKYSPSDYFSQDLYRHVYTAYPSEYFGDYSFQLDEEGNPYWVYTLLQARTVSGCKTPYGCIIIDAVTGSMTKYDDLDEIPVWVELVFTGERVESLYNRYGSYINGFWNFSNKGVTATTEDYGYIQFNEDIYIYTGVTSAGADESNLGFILVNSRTGDCIYYPIAGAEEYSSMSAAEGLVQNYGYEASFPSLVLVEEEPTYVLVLKDANGLIKQYSMVNYKNYSIAVVADTLEDCQKEYAKALTGKTVEEVDPEKTVTESFIIDEIEYITIEGNTICYIKSGDKCFKQSFAENEELILLKVGNEVSIQYQQSEYSIIPIVNIERN